MIGENVCFYGNTYLNTNGPDGAIRIGDGSHFDQFCVLQGQGGLTIGRDCAISSGVLIYSQTNHDFLHDGTSVTKQPTRYAPVNIGNACWIGAGAIILPGVTVGDGARIGAGAVVLNDVPPSTTVAGVPARPLVQES
jgi:acetyltransferase-like isoleucine patch superfamily enzyme